MNRNSSSNGIKNSGAGDSNKGSSSSSSIHKASAATAAAGGDSDEGQGLPEPFGILRRLPPDSPPWADYRSWGPQVVGQGVAEPWGQGRGGPGSREGGNQKEEGDK